ncbi:MAG: VWA domain-containing protein [Candidatus Acidiferrales bacterium]
MRRGSAGSMPAIVLRARGASLLLFALIVAAALTLAGSSVSLAQPPQEHRIIRNVDLVVLHTTVVDQRTGHIVTDLKRGNFRVFEDKIEQKLDSFKQEDVPVTVGLVVDNSGSMREKRESVNSAALTFVKTSNPEDEVFVVNFNDEYYLDLDKDFTNDLTELKDALERIDSRGSTAMYDAVIGSLDHLKKGKRDKKVLLVISDGIDNASRVGSGDWKRGLQIAMLEAQKSEALIYMVGLFGDERGREKRQAREVLTKIAEATGGLAFFPETLAEVEPICTLIAHDIRNQYTLTYYPSNTAKDGTFRRVEVTLEDVPRNRGKLNVRSRTGYYAPKSTSGN